VGAHVAAGLPAELERPGRRLPDSTYWVFPVLSADPSGLVRALRESGFDATRGTSAIATVEPPAGRGELEPQEARRLMAGIVFLPVYPELSIATLDRLAEAVRRAELRDSRSVPAEAETVTA
jgi:dTDP-4-amino-4,6-dideoxygalactose transaminase